MHMRGFIDTSLLIGMLKGIKGLCNKTKIFLTRAPLSGESKGVRFTGEQGRGGGEGNGEGEEEGGSRKGKIVILLRKLELAWGSFNSPVHAHNTEWIFTAWACTAKACTAKAFSCDGRVWR
jgi:hypothetical protein